MRPARTCRTARNVTTRALVTCVAFICVASERAPALTDAAKPTRRPHLSAQRLLQIALANAVRADDRAPTLIQHVEGQAYRLNLVASGDYVPGYQWAYLIAERGRFTLADVPGPPSAAAPKGTVLTLVIDARTGRLTSRGLSDRYPALGRIGRVHTDLRTGKH